MRHPRLFIALEIPRDIQTSLARSFHELDLVGSDFRRVEPRNLHITIKFLGPTPIERIADIISALHRVAQTQRAPEMTFTHGMLIPPSRAKALALSIQPTASLVGLYTEVEIQLAEANIAHPERRRFTPHLTLARMRGALSSDDATRVKKWSYHLPFTAHALTLFESTLKPTGPVYTPLTAVSLP